MARISVLFVDDEEDIRATFHDRFEDQFDITLAKNGREALEHLHGGADTAVVVTDLRMPVLAGLDLIKEAKEHFPDLGFIVVSGHGDTDDVIAALRLGARNFIRKPYSFAELEEAVRLEGRRHRLIQDERARQAIEQATEQYLVGVTELAYELPNSVEWVNTLTFRLVGLMEVLGICDEHNRSNVALGLIEIMTNAVEHGNLGISGSLKSQLMTEGEQTFRQEVERRATLQPYSARKVRVSASISGREARLVIEDQGEGFDFTDLPDPTDPNNLFLPNGRGILLARSFIDEVHYGGRGNTCTLVMRRQAKA